jgi:hypothetical protein
MPLVPGLVRQLEQLEQRWVSHLSKRLAPWPALANGEVQFFALDGVQRLDADFLIACIGINYDQRQRSPAASRRPYLYTKNQMTSWVTDSSWPQTRRALVAALGEYLADPEVWFTRGYASAANLLPNAWSAGQADYPFVFVMTNLSPFISQQQWALHSGRDKATAVAAWDPNQHICDLIRHIGRDVDLWVIHGIDYVWQHFDRSSAIVNWLMIPNLNPQSVALGHFRNFWRNTTRKVAPKSPQVPNC